MDDASGRTALLVARTAESRGCLRPGDWPDVAVSLLLEGAEDPAIAELAGLSRQANGWDTEPLVAAACERHEIVVPDCDESTILLARLMADDVRARPTVVTAPMTRLLAGLGFEAELQSMPTLGLSAPVTQALARPLRSTLPTTQPAYGHHEH